MSAIEQFRRMGNSNGAVQPDAPEGPILQVHRVVLEKVLAQLTFNLKQPNVVSQQLIEQIAQILSRT